jgi:hypothetical protein
MPDLGKLDGYNIHDPQGEFKGEDVSIVKSDYKPKPPVIAPPYISPGTSPKAVIPPSSSKDLPHPVPDTSMPPKAVATALHLETGKKRKHKEVKKRTSSITSLDLEGTGNHPYKRQTAKRSRPFISKFNNGTSGHLNLKQ